MIAFFFVSFFFSLSFAEEIPIAIGGSFRDPGEEGPSAFQNL